MIERENLGLLGPCWRWRIILGDQENALRAEQVPPTVAFRSSLATNKLIALGDV